MDLPLVNSLKQLNQRLKIRIDLIEYSELINFEISGIIQNLYFVLLELKIEDKNKFVSYQVLEALTGYKRKKLQRILCDMERLSLATRVFNKQNKVIDIKVHDPSSLITNYYTSISLTLNHPEHILKITEETDKFSENLNLEQPHD